MIKLPAILLACAASLLAPAAAQAADQILSGAISSQSGQKLEGVTVSAKREGSTIATSVYTDTTGKYYFPPLPAGKYRVWAQALGFNAEKASVDLAAAHHRNFTLREITDPEARHRQLPGELMVAALPETTAEDAHMKRMFTNNCTGCHSTSYALQFRFDEAGWSKIIDLMKKVPVTGVYPGPKAVSNQILEHDQKQLAAYLARARGPGESSMKYVTRARPTGEAARAVWTLYDVPLNPEAGIGTLHHANDGTDWAMGTTSKLGQLPHDGGMGLDGTIYFTVNNPNRSVTVGKLDPKTGAIKFLKADAANGKRPPRTGWHATATAISGLTSTRGAARSASSIPPPRSSPFTRRPKACRRSAAPRQWTSTARAWSGLPPPTARYASIRWPRSSPSSGR